MIAKSYEDIDMKFALDMIRRGRRHDISKLSIPEFTELLDTNHINFHKRLQHHRTHNDHHPEYWTGGIKFMINAPAAAAEMVCDWKARAEEFGTSLDEWIEKSLSIYNYTTNDSIYQLIMKYKNILTQTKFKD